MMNSPRPRTRFEPCVSQLHSTKVFFRWSLRNAGEASKVQREGSEEDNGEDEREEKEDGPTAAEAAAAPTQYARSSSAALETARRRSPQYTSEPKRLSGDEE
eukprot:3941978-Pyramimonas_sp.AAC.1